MGPHGRDDDRTIRRLRLREGAEAGATEEHGDGFGSDLVFDFTGLDAPGLQDLALILTARLGAGPEGRVWVRALPHRTWKVLHGLGLDHLFRPFPTTSSSPN